MGWLFTLGQTRLETIKRVTRPWDYKKEGVKGICLAHKVLGNVVWSVWELEYRDSRTERFIGCDLLRVDKGYGWGYKDMSESSHPHYYSCPLSYLDMVPTVKSEEWRRRVREYHACRKARRSACRSIVVGSVVRLVSGCKVQQVTIERVKPLIGRDVYGALWKIPTRFVNEVLPVPQAGTSNTLLGEKEGA